MLTLAQRDALLSRAAGVVWPYGPLLDWLQLPAGAAVLDIGGGEGQLGAELRRRGHTGRVEVADLHSGVDAHRLPYPASSFDLVLLRVLAHLHAPALALSEARRVARPSGRVVVAAHGPGHLAGLLPGGGQPDLPVLRVPVHLSAADSAALARAYGVPEAGTLDSVLELTVMFS